MNDFESVRFTKSNSSQNYRGVDNSDAHAGDPNSKSALDRRLDQALEETFPASDPVSILMS